MFVVNALSGALTRAPASTPAIARARTVARNRLVDGALLAMLALLALMFASPVRAQDAARPEAMVGFFANQTHNTAQIGKLHNRGKRHEFFARADRSGVQAMIQSEVCAQIGCQWTSTALRIAKIESGFNCRARNGRAVGIFQTTNPAMFGVSRAAALTCGGGIRAGVAHMRLCIAKGARTAAMQMRCHNSGSPWGASNAPTASH